MILNIKEIADSLQELDEQSATLQATIATQLKEISDKKNALKIALESAVTDKVTLELSAKEYGCGTVNIVDGNVKVKIVVTKKVKWEDSKLESIYNEIKESGVDPCAYIQINYKVNENNFKSWGDNVQGYFRDARTVEASKPVITIERVKNV